MSADLDELNPRTSAQSACIRVLFFGPNVFRHGTLIENANNRRVRLCCGNDLLPMDESPSPPRTPLSLPLG